MHGTPARTTALKSDATAQQQTPLKVFAPAGTRPLIPQDCEARRFRALPAVFGAAGHGRGLLHLRLSDEFGVFRFR